MKLLQKPMLARVLKWLFFVLVCYFPIFLHLDNQSIRIWDESRQAVNALEMSANGNYLVAHYMGEPEMWSTKPPMLIWMQVFFIKLMGAGELAVRLPAAISALLTCVLLMVFCLKLFRSYWLGMICTLLLVTSEGFVGFHASRTGDFDVPLALFSTCFLLSYYYCFAKGKGVFLFYAMCALTFAALTKGVAALFFVPAVLLHVLANKQLVSILKTKYFWLGVAVFLFSVGGFYMGREYLNPGYLAAVGENELWGRFLVSQDEHQHEFLFYLTNWRDAGFASWFWYLPPSLFAVFVLKDEKMKRFLYFVLLCVVSFLLIISAGKTKIAWYDVPMYPLLVFIPASLIYSLFNMAKRIDVAAKIYSFNFLPYLLLFVVFIQPYNEAFSRSYFPKDLPKWKETYSLSYFLRDIIRGNESTEARIYCKDGYDANNVFYLTMLRMQGVDILEKERHLLAEGDLILVYQCDVAAYIERNYEVKEKSFRKNIWEYRVGGKKENAESDPMAVAECVKAMN